MRRPMLAATTPGLPVHMVVLAVLFTDWTRGSLAILAPTSTHRFPEPLLAASVDKTPAAARHPRIHRHHCPRPRLRGAAGCLARGPERSEEHTSELQSLMRNSYAVFCLKKKKIQ